MGAILNREDNAQCETLNLDSETFALLRQQQQKTGMDINALVKQAVDTVYHDLDDEPT